MENIILEITILKPVNKVWDFFTEPEHIKRWNYTNERWVCPRAENNLEVGGSFNYRMEAKDGTFGFDFKGIYDKIDPLKEIKFHLDDGRKFQILFNSMEENMTQVTEIFDPKPEESAQMQHEEWYAILNNFHKYVENN